MNDRRWLLVLGLFSIGCSTSVPRAAGPSEVIEVTDESFQTSVLEASQPVLVDFWAPWCGPCKMMGPVVEELSAQYSGSVKVCKVNVDDCPAVTKRYDIQSIPSLLVFKSGEIKERFVGVQPKNRVQTALEDARQ